jgi:Asp/Glu/hydantoin racemase
MGVSTFIVGNKSVILVDCSYMTTEQSEELRETLQSAKQIIASSKEKAVYVITDVTNTRFNPDIVSEFSDFALSNTKYIHTSVIVGINETNRLVFSAIKSIAKRDFILAGSLYEAKKIITSMINSYNP